MWHHGESRPKRAKRLRIRNRHGPSGVSGSLGHVVTRELADGTQQCQNQCAVINLHVGQTIRQQRGTPVCIGNADPAMQRHRGGRTLDERSVVMRDARRTFAYRHADWLRPTHRPERSIGPHGVSPNIRTPTDAQAMVPLPIHALDIAAQVRRLRVQDQRRHDVHRTMSFVIRLAAKRHRCQIGEYGSTDRARQQPAKLHARAKGSHIAHARTGEAQRHRCSAK